MTRSVQRASAVASPKGATTIDERGRRSHAARDGLPRADGLDPDAVAPLVEDDLEQRVAANDEDVEHARNVGREPEAVKPAAFQGRVQPKLAFGRFRVLHRTDGKWIVYDPRLPFPTRTAFLSDSQERAIAECRRLSDLANRLGEPNEPERTGWTLDWSDPASWEPAPWRRRP